MVNGTQHSFQNILKLIAKITQNKHFDQQLETRIVCDASNTGLGAALEQISPQGWIAVAYASRFLKANSRTTKTKLTCHTRTGGV